MSPIAAIPHKSRAYRLILDLSFGLRVGGETKKSVNDTSSPAAPREALDYIGMTLPRIIHAVASAATNTPCLFAKADVKDGFGGFLWEMEIDGTLRVCFQNEINMTANS